MRVKTGRRSIGVNFDKNGVAEIAIWAPLAHKVSIVLEDGKIDLINENRYWKSITKEIQPGTRYKISIDDLDPLPDPASLSQPEGVHGSSEAINLNVFRWSDSSWKNIPLEKYIIYELHTGTFSPEHNFEGIIKKIPHLLDLGITAIEIMPVGQFPGDRNWGYDGVYPFAVQHSYGGAQALQKLVDECHKNNIAVVLDVIYNHIGPEGNYLAQFAPYFTGKYKTPWGQALNFDDAWCDGVREYFIENVLMWFRDFHIDALRMDAVHAIKDLSPTHIVKEIRQHVDELEKNNGRKYYLITELDLNDPVFINPYNKGGYGADAQWIDEFHHALRVTSGQKPEGYYSDFNGIEHLAKSYNDAYVYDGQYSLHRKKLFGAKTNNPGRQFVVFSQNHDQTGNRMLGERTSQLVSMEMCKLLAAAVIVSPYIPMLFMGEEWAEPHPFLFFISHTDEKLAALVNKGRKEEFSYFNWQGEPPDPRLEKTFTDSMLQWDLLNNVTHKSMFGYYKKLIALRKTLPALANTDRKKTLAEADVETKILKLQRWSDEQRLECFLNFSDKDQPVPLAAAKQYKKIFDSSGSPSDQLIRAESIIIFERR
ncbi:MAG: malto-oligosyltrehalose trehalohydrolase [Chitinophagaceae bacterium]|nr:malto-oligosyltrehalose trehalohydrolase [Chitinophagaceae bacterium]